MTDIRSNIREMIDAVRTEQAKLRERLVTLEQREATLRSWLTEEEPKQVELMIKSRIPTKSVSPLSAFLRETIADGKPYSTGDLATLAKARGLIDENKSPRRSVNFAMQSLRNAGVVKMLQTKWVAKTDTH